MLEWAAWRLLLVVACGFALGGAAIAADECMKYFPETGKVRAVPCDLDEPSAPSESEAPAAPSKSEAPAAPSKSEAPTAPRKSEAPAAPSPAAAAGRQCMKYIPAVDINVAVECDEFKPAVPPTAAAPAPPPPASPAPAATSPPPNVKVPATKTYPVTALKQKLAAMTTALTEAKADTAFHESYCTLNATSQVMHREEVKKDKDEVKRLLKLYDALEAKVGDRGRWVYTALQEEVMDMTLGTPVDDAIPSTRLRQTPEGQAFLKARDSLVQMSCNCMYDKPTGRLFCCISCSQEALKARF